MSASRPTIREGSTALVDATGDPTEIRSGLAEMLLQEDERLRLQIEPGLDPLLSNGIGYRPIIGVQF